ncbi:hypothetical protein TVAG_005310 [Trichomonas vaginalis G3]|uniref:Uncharacterized protein n=1 Tax=Trichomonas vaginalis (strain ATCC PRA-98 / G3) TaxID=412133 RepID=A2ENR1_TRIV3|nr:hypothetical protein TVAGG3_0666330 [Trichomonas vaginalis G3]EAY05687.1 hypothetical protein TVAG_005310 [Trichomonas vaginalis G3]KAI5506857.1 hypothetical protein TVAGG3_0666330 [Trichomonas vaginalis G3]|eukprot:XP_001317910.1 hypothetical protein [Trichomonas vaginalis G3]
MILYSRIRKTVKFPPDKNAQKTAIMFSVIGRSGGSMMELKNGQCEVKKVCKLTVDRHDVVKITLTTEDKSHSLGKTTVPVECFSSNTKCKAVLTLNTRLDFDPIFEFEFHLAKKEGNPFHADKGNFKKDLIKEPPETTFKEKMRRETMPAPAPVRVERSSSYSSEESSSESESSDSSYSQDDAHTQVNVRPLARPMPPKSSAPIPNAKPISPRPPYDPQIHISDSNKVIDLEIQCPISALRVPPFKTLLTEAYLPLQQKNLFDGCIQTPETMPQLFGM